MPTYEYACTSCGHHLEIFQSFSDDPLTTCPTCGGDLRKVFGSIGIVLKGSGFYRNDSRSSSNGKSPAKDKDKKDRDNKDKKDTASSTSAGDSAGTGSGSTGTSGTSSASSTPPSSGSSSSAATSSTAAAS